MFQCQIKVLISHKRFWFSFTGQTSENSPTHWKTSNMPTALLASCGYVVHIKTFCYYPDLNCMGPQYWAAHQKLPQHLLPTKLNFVTGKCLMMTLGHMVSLIKIR